MKKYIFCIILCSLINVSIHWQSEVKNLAKDFIQEYHSFGIQPLSLSFIDNLNNIKSLDSLKKQEVFFLKYENLLSEIDVPTVSSHDFADYEILNYEIKRNLERIKLSKKIKKQIDTKEFSYEKIFDIPDGKEWYKYYIKAWTNSEVTPEDLIVLGEKEVKEAENEIEKIRIESGKTKTEFKEFLNSNSFFITNKDSLYKIFEAKKKNIWSNLYRQFNNPDKISDLKIEKGTNERMAVAPGYYLPDTHTFYYNYFDRPYNVRQVDWLLIHEGIPGHHFQTSWMDNLKLTDLRNEFKYFGFLEGWAAYAEEIGKEVGAYKTIYDYLGKWEWD